MPTDVFHMDANGVRISVDRAVFAEHAYATRNIASIATVADRGILWPGRITLLLGFGLLAAGVLISNPITLMLGGVATLSGSLNLARKRTKYGVRIVTQRGPVYVLASQDKRYAETVSTALRKAVEASRQRREAAYSDSGSAGADGGAAPAASSDSSRPRGGAQPRFRRKRRRQGKG